MPVASYDILKAVLPYIIGWLVIICVFTEST